MATCGTVQSIIVLNRGYLYDQVINWTEIGIIVKLQILILNVLINTKQNGYMYWMGTDFNQDIH